MTINPRDLDCTVKISSLEHMTHDDYVVASALFSKLFEEALRKLDASR